MTFEEAQKSQKCSLCGELRPERLSGRRRGWVVDVHHKGCLLICGYCRNVKIPDELYEEASAAE